MYIQQRQDLEGPLQHHCGFQQNNLNKMWNKNNHMGLFNPSLRCFEIWFQTNTVQPQPAKRNAYMIAESTAAVLIWTIWPLIAHSAPAKWGVLRGNGCAVTGTVEWESRKCEPVHKHTGSYSLLQMQAMPFMCLLVCVCVFLLNSCLCHITTLHAVKSGHNGVVFMANVIVF